MTALECSGVAGKAVEMFILELVDKTAVVARANGAKSISDAHLYVVQPRLLPCVAHLLDRLND